jgi:hypothetical protein
MVFRNVGCLYHHKMVAYPNTSELPWQTPHDFSHPQCSLRFRQALPSVNAPAFQAAPIRAADHIRAVAAQGRHRILGVCLAKDRMAIRIFSTWICQISPSLCVYLCIYIYIQHRVLVQMWDYDGLWIWRVYRTGLRKVAISSDRIQWIGRDYTVSSSLERKKIYK